MNEALRLIVNADDFGFTRDVNEGIVASHRNGILTATTLMASGSAFRHAIELAKSTPTLDVGCHLVLVQGPNLPPSLPALLFALTTNKIDPLRIFRRQIEIVLKAGIRPTHLDTHKHTHLLPSVRRAVLQLSEQYSIPWIRKPADYSIDPSAPLATRAATLAMRAALKNFDGQLLRVKGRRTDRFIGFQLTGRMTPENLAETLRKLPAGCTELMCHPGLLGTELPAATTRLKQSRVEEWRALCSPLVRQTIAERNIELVGYRDL